MISEEKVKLYCCENISKIENYREAVNSSEKWHCHHRLETHNSNGERRSIDLSYKELIALDMYYHRSASELIFLAGTEHVKLHKRGAKHSEETKRRITEKLKGRKVKPHSEEMKRKMSEVMKGRHWKLVDRKHVYY